MDEIREEALRLRQAGMESAASIWETLENLPQPIDPANIYKAVSSVKVAEFIARIRNHKLAPALMVCVSQFFEETINIVEEGEIREGVRALVVIEEAMPMTDEISKDPEAGVTRQFAYDGILLLAAVKLGKETETKKCIDEMQDGVAKILIMSYIQDGILGSDFDPDKAQA